MATADEQIRVSDRVEREFKRRRGGESFNDVLEDENAGDFDDGVGTLLYNT